MNSEELYSVVRSVYILNKFVRGIYAADELPEIVNSYPAGYIVNTDVSTYSGQHWIAIWMENAEHSEVFDSFGNYSSYFNNSIYMFLNDNNNQILYNNYILQNKYSYVCGYYVLYYLFMKCEKNTMETVLSIFGENKTQNDAIVTNFLEYLLS